MTSEREPERKRLWFPILRLSLFFAVVVVGMTLFLNIFNPHTEYNPQEWENKPKVSKPIELFIRLLKKKEKTNEK